MTDTSELYSIAEIAVTIAGFAALVSVLAWRRDDVDARAEGLRLIVALEASLFVAAFALLPLVPHKFGASAELAWRLAAAAYFAGDATFSVLIARRIRAVESFWPDVTLSRLIWGVSVVGQLLLVMAVIGVPAGTSSAYYFSALYANLVNSGLLFLVVAWNTFVPRR